MLATSVKKLVEGLFTMPFYAVRIGRTPGVYSTWNACKAEVDNFPKARYKKFETEVEAEAFVSGSDQPGKSASEPSSSKSPAVKGSKSLKKEASHSDKPYSRPFSTSASKEAKKTKLLEIDEVKKLAKESVPEDSSKGVVVYTDGACCFNGKHGAQAGIGIYWGPDDPRNVSEHLDIEKPTNNRAEIHAVVKAVEQAKEQGIKQLNVHTDCQFLINAMTKWIQGWKKKGWKLSTGGDVINRADFETLEKACEGIEINYTHVKGHEGVPGNEAADKLAVQGTKKKR